MNWPRFGSLCVLRVACSALVDRGRSREVGALEGGRSRWREVEGSLGGFCDLSSGIKPKMVPFASPDAAVAVLACRAPACRQALRASCGGSQRGRGEWTGGGTGYVHWTLDGALMRRWMDGAWMDRDHDAMRESSSKIKWTATPQPPHRSRQSSTAAPGIG